jgi:hypothetical protein
LQLRQNRAAAGLSLTQVQIAKLKAASTPCRFSITGTFINSPSSITAELQSWNIYIVNDKNRKIQQFRAKLRKNFIAFVIKMHRCMCVPLMNSFI